MITKQCLILMTGCAWILVFIPMLVKSQERCLEKGNIIISEINETQAYISNSSHSCTFMYLFDFSELNDTEIMDIRLDVVVEIDSTNKEARERPLMVSIRQQHTNTHIKLPYAFAESPDENNTWYYATRRTLCLPKTSYEHGIRNREETSVIISVDTYSDSGISFKLKLQRSTGLLMHVGDDRIFTVDPMSTTYYRFEFENNPNIQMIDILSKTSGIGEKICTIVAIDNPTCPIYDIEENVARTSEYKRMTGSAVTRLKRSQFPKGMTIIFIPLSTDKDCMTAREWTKSGGVGLENNPYRNKELSVRIRATMDYNLAWMFGIPIIGVFVPCLLITLIIFCICDRRLKREYKESIERVTDEVITQMLPSVNGASNITNDDELTYHGIVANIDTWGARKSSHRYCSATCFVSVFYVIPVYQFLYYHWKSMTDTGDFDHCYYNELCRIRVEDISDFNHLISNLLYIVFGLTFILIVYWRSVTLFNLKEYRAIHRGLCVPFGAYMAMGISLMMEGVLSSAYHFCPSSSTFQFDVAFMYVIAVILLSTIHQLRFHASPSGTKAFVLLTFLTIISALFYVIESRWDDQKATFARLIFATAHLIFTGLYCVGLYFHGTIKHERGTWMLGFYKGVCFVLIPTRLRLKLSKTPFEMEELRVITHPNPQVRIMKKLMYSLLFIFNVTASFYLVIHEDFAHYLLNLLIFNVVLSLVSYITWKIFFWHQNNKHRQVAADGSRPRWKRISPYLLQTGIYLTIGILFFVCAFKKFNVSITEWRASAAESRTLNVPCSDFWSNFYDHHDVWHFFSAVALFFFFMGILTIDDGIILEDRRNIKIF